MKTAFFKIAILMLSLLYISNLSAQKFRIGEEFETDINTTKVYQKFKKSTKSNTKELVYQKEFFSKNSSYIKIYFKNFDLAKGDYVKITGVNSKESIIYGGKGKIIDKAMTTISDFWSNVIFDDKVVLKLYSSGLARNHKGFEIAKVAYGYSNEKIKKLMSSKNRSICRQDNKEAIICYENTTMFDKSRAVCKLLIGGTVSCTGWLLGTEGHLMTNNHCIENKNEAQNTDFIFNYQYSNCAETTFEFLDVVASSSKLIKTDSLLDYTLVKLPVNPTNTYGYLSLSSTIARAGDRIYIPQHPGGRRKEISVITDVGGNPNGHSIVFESSNVSGPQVRYFADTEGGSSGSPVMDFNSNLVISIHNRGGCPNSSHGRSDNLIASIGNDMPKRGIDDSHSGGNQRECTEVISLFPYQNSFEENIGWVNSSTDDFNWVINSESTPTQETGPSAANEGLNYLYAEASGPNNPSKSAVIISPCFNLKKATNAKFGFDYHIYGSSKSTLELEVSVDRGNSWNKIWQKSGNKGNRWISTLLGLKQYAGQRIKLRFTATTGDNEQGDIALDNFNLSLTKGSNNGDDVFENFTTSNNNVNDLMIYPNPVSELLTLKIPEKTLSGTYKIINITGSVIKTGKLSQQISLNGMKEGFYILEVATNTSEYSKAFIKEKSK